jgi:hypothetical protein
MSDAALSAVNQESTLQDFIDQVMAAQDRAELDDRANAAYWAVRHMYPLGFDQDNALARLQDAYREALEAIKAREARA